VGDIQARRRAMDGGVIKPARLMVDRQVNRGALFKNHH
jgi:hypothetical protein